MCFYVMVLERLVMEEQARLLATLPSERQEAYYDAVTV